MKAEIRSIVTLDNYEEITCYRPKNRNVFSIWFRLMVGPKGFEGEESFDVNICTPQWLVENHKQDCVLFGRHLLIVSKYDYELIVRELNAYVDQWDETSWQDLAKRISRIGHWEFEDYRENTISA